MAPRRRRRSKDFLDIANSLRRDVDESVVTALRQAAVQIMNELADAGPGYSGKFSSAWYAVPPGGSPGSNRSTDRLYGYEGDVKYDLRNVPKSKFKKLKEGTYYEIVNGMDYAPQALDLEPGEFIQPEDEPIKDPPVNRGKRTGDFRYEVVGNEPEGAVSTAKANWYNTYSSGGALSKSFEQGVKLGFRQAAKSRGGGFR
jgi:hypothetical protein